MKSKFFRLVAACLVAVLTLALFVQSPTFAIGGDEDRHVGSRIERKTPSAEASSRNSEDSQSVSEKKNRDRVNFSDLKALQLPGEPSCMCDGTPEVCDRMCNFEGAEKRSNNRVAAGGIKF